MYVIDSISYIILEINGDYYKECVDICAHKKIYSTRPFLPIPSHTRIFRHRAYTNR